MIRRSSGTRAASRASPCYDSMPACAACHCARRPGEPPCMIAAERDCCRQLAGRELVLTADTLRPRDRGHDEFFLFQVLANADATLNVAAARSCCTRRRRRRRSQRRGPRRRCPRAVLDPLALEPPPSSCRPPVPRPLARRRLLRHRVTAPAGRPRARGHGLLYDQAVCAWCVQGRRSCDESLLFWRSCIACTSRLTLPFDASR